MASLGRYERSTNIWPGFVDALATLLMVIIFLLLIFVLAQFFLGQALSGRDSALQRLEIQVSELADLLSLEKRANNNLTENLAQLSSMKQSPYFQVFAEEAGTWDKRSARGKSSNTRACMP